LAGIDHLKARSSERVPEGATSSAPKAPVIRPVVILQTTECKVAAKAGGRKEPVCCGTPCRKGSRARGWLTGFVAASALLIRFLGFHDRRAKLRTYAKAGLSCIDSM
jgi:hypothetical protein